MNNIIEIFESISGGTSAFISYILLSHILDHFITVKESNLISLLVSSIINFIIQTKIFSHGKLTNYKIGKYIFVNIIEIISNQSALLYLLKKKKEILKQISNNFIKRHYNTFIRILITLILFIFISYPTRKYWIYY
tara:strand:+ start:1267 stop:1674 length:408 start_codon:yes stop_codon:yes gene_type:complete